MRQERQSVFETNSSSTHSICIATNRNTELTYPEKLYFKCKEFGWDIRHLTSPEDKAAYLYASFLELYSRDKAQEVMAFIMEVLQDVGVQCEFETPVYRRYGDGVFYVQNAGVDHCGEDDHRRFVDKTTNNKGRLLRYLFSDESFVLMGNDNSEHDVTIRAFYPHEEYYKGN